MMFISQSRTFAVIAAAQISIGAPAMSNASSTATDPPLVEECNRKWEQVVAQNKGGDYATLLQLWKNVSKQCAGSGVYEYRLGLLLERVGNLPEAIAVLNGAVEKNLPKHDDLYVTLLTFRFTQALSKNPADAELAQQNVEMLRKFVERHPSSLNGVQQLASLEMLSGNYSKAIVLSQAALALDERSWNAKRTLVIAAAHDGKYSEGKKHIRQAIELHEGLMSDTQFMISAATCYFSVGDIATAEQVLLGLRERVPSIKDDAQFRNLATKIVESKKAR